MNEVGFIGDVHGRLAPLMSLVEMVANQVAELVFLGDYVNRGTQSKEVLEYLSGLQDTGTIRCRFVAGNHDMAFLDAIDGALDPFLRIGGAATIRSYVPAPQGDVLAQLREAVPKHHLEFLRGLEETVTGAGWYATHIQPTGKENTRLFGVFGHVPQRDLTPTVTATHALIDTGCGTLDEGPLTCFLWPSLSWTQIGPLDR